MASTLRVMRGALTCVGPVPAGWGPVPFCEFQRAKMQAWAPSWLRAEPVRDCPIAVVCPGVSIPGHTRSACPSRPMLPGFQRRLSRPQARRCSKRSLACRHLCQFVTVSRGQSRGPMRQRKAEAALHLSPRTPALLPRRPSSSPPRAGILHPILEVVHIEVDDGRGVERQHLADDEAADDGDAQRTADLGADSACRAPAEARRAWPPRWSS